MHPNLRLATLLATGLLLLPGTASAAPLDRLLPPEHPGTCLADRPALYCADATAATTLSCSLTATDYTCTVTADWGSAGSTRSPLPGDVLKPATLDLRGCDGSTCWQDLQPVGAPCSWGLGGHSCSTSGSFSHTYTGTYTGCVEAYVSLGSESDVHVPGVGVAAVADSAHDGQIYTTC